MPPGPTGPVASEHWAHGRAAQPARPPKASGSVGAAPGAASGSASGLCVRARGNIGAGERTHLEHDAVGAGHLDRRARRQVRPVTVQVTSPSLIRPRPLAIGSARAAWRPMYWSPRRLRCGWSLCAGCAACQRRQPSTLATARPANARTWKSADPRPQPQAAADPAGGDAEPQEHKARHQRLDDQKRATERPPVSVLDRSEQRITAGRSRSPHRSAGRTPRARSRSGPSSCSRRDSSCWKARSRFGSAARAFDILVALIERAGELMARV